MKDAIRHPTVAILGERQDGSDRRVALVPDDARKLADKVTLFVERGAGARAGFPDIAYEQAGATLADRQGALAKADIIISVRAPDVEMLPPGAVLVSLGGRDDALVREIGQRGVTFLGLERLPRITRAQNMDVLSSQASIAGYAAVIEAARELDVLLPMMTTAAGGIKPARMIALGAGVAGLQAIATARRLGAVAHGFDVRSVAREQVESLGARFITVDDAGTRSDAAGGYAAEQPREAQENLRRKLSQHLSTMQMIVTTAQVPGRPAPLLIDRATLAQLRPGAVIVDLAAETGGNCELTVKDEVVIHDGVRILGPTNLPSMFATDASRLFSGNVRALLDHLHSLDAGLELKFTDEITSALLGELLAAAA